MADESTGATTRIELPFPEETPRRLRVTLGPGKLTVRPGAPEPWVTGTSRGDDGRSLPKIEHDDAATTISQRGGGSFRLRRGLSPHLELALGTAHPYALVLEGGASDTDCDLGGLPLESMIGEFGAGRVKIDASSPNPEPMKKLAIQAGATHLTLSNAANFNAGEISIEGGAAAFQIDFGGEFRRDCHARITTGVASLSITIPRGMAAKVNADTTLGSLSIGDGFMTRSGAYWTEAAVLGDTPVLTLEASSSLGSLNIHIGD